MRVHLRTCRDGKSFLWKLQDERGWRVCVVYSHVALELKLEEVVGDLGSALTREHKHLVPAHSYREVAARWRNLATLVDLWKTQTTILTH